MVKRLELLVVLYFSAILLMILFQTLSTSSWLKPYYDNNVTANIGVLQGQIPFVAYKDLSEFKKTIQKLVDKGKLSAEADFTRRDFIVKLEDVLSPEQRKKMTFSDGLPLSKAEGRMKTEGCNLSKIAFFSSKGGKVVLYSCRKGVLDASRPHLFYRD